MERVAQSLEAQAIALRADQLGADLFGRSAFNRYYYAVYLRAREMLTEFNPGWRTTPHAKMPLILEGPVKAAIKKAKQKAVKLGDSDSIGLCSRGLSAVDQLCALMRVGYSVRVAADYDPTVSITFADDGRHFSLASTPVATARRWVERSEFLESSVRRAWKFADGY